MSTILFMRALWLRKIFFPNCSYYKSNPDSSSNNERSSNLKFRTTSHVFFQCDRTKILRSFVIRKHHRILNILYFFVHTHSVQCDIVFEVCLFSYKRRIFFKYTYILYILIGFEDMIVVFEACLFI